jgi:hypothetical protein
MSNSRILNANWRGSVFNEQAAQLRSSVIGRTGITYPWFSYSSLRETHFHFMRNQLVVLKSPAIHSLAHNATVMYVTRCFKFPINDNPPFSNIFVGYAIHRQATAFVVSCTKHQVFPLWLCSGFSLPTWKPLVTANKCPWTRVRRKLWLRIKHTASYSQFEGYIC